jgi:hypothetical protein
MVMCLVVVHIMGDGDGDGGDDDDEGEEDVLYDNGAYNGCYVSVGFIV